MLNMKLPVRTGEAGGGEAGAECCCMERRRRVPGSGRPEEPGARDKEPGARDKEAVFQWFGLHLDPARRIEFMCGLLHMCQPLELRFLGSYLEDLARKDYHVLRDAESRANSPADLGSMTDPLDPVVRSKLLVCLSLLQSDNRECAGILFRILSHMDPGLFSQDSPLHPHLLRQRQRLSSGPPQPPEPRCGPLEQLALLFTMASVHPAFHFHQREAVREQLDRMQLVLEQQDKVQLVLEQPAALRAAEAPQLTGLPADYLASPPLGLGECSASHPPCQGRRSACRPAQREAVHIEGIMLSGVSRTRVDKEYNFEVKWSDSSSSSVTKTHLELENFLLKLPKDQCTESFKKNILRLLNQGDQYESRDMEKNLRERFLSAPPLFRKTRKVCSFFNCDSSYSTKPACCRCNCQPGPVYQADCSDASSQEEESYIQGHKKKPSSKSPCQPSLSSAKGFQGDVRMAPHSNELNGPAERRKKSSSVRSSQEAEQHPDSKERSHPATKIKSRGLPAGRDQATGTGATLVSNGGLGPASSSHRKAGGSGPDTFGETLSESYSSPSSPHHQESLDSEDDNNKDSDSHSDDATKAAGLDGLSNRHVAGPNVLPPNVLPPNVLPCVLPLSSSSPLHPESRSDFPPLSFIHPLPYVLPNMAPDPSLPLVSPPSVPEGTSSSGKLMMPLVSPAAPAAGELEKREAPPTFGVPGLPPLVQRFKTVSHVQGGGDGAPGGSTIRAMGVLPPGSSYSSSPLLPAQDLPSSHVEAPHAKHPGAALPSGLPSAYSLPPAPSVGLPPAGSPAATAIALSPGHVQSCVPPAVPTHTPGPAPSPSPALTHSIAHSDCTSYSNSSTACGSAEATPQQTAPPPQQQQPIGCGTCGCHNNCGSRGNSSGGVGSSSCQTPLFFPAHQMAAARQVFSVAPPLFQLTSLCSSSYLTQTHPHQANGATALQQFFPTVPPSAHPPPYLHSHAHSHADVPSHMLSSQAVAVAAAASYGLQQQMAPAASFCQQVYQQVFPNPLGLLPAATLGTNKKNANMSCYNCGVSGHYAQDCNQPSLDAAQQGGFRLKYTASHVSDALDNAD